jgi:23S rRNA (cytidine1920-2'-O)/16S rRNA (cytidine1409-2'-O)-methyltransferase
VRVDGRPVSKPAARAAGTITVAADPNPWVSRAGLKLDHALAVFGLTPSGVALDIGASTGGFTQVLLARGAAHVHAVDVGRGQLHPDIAADPRVTEHSGVNVRDLSADQVPPPDWITADVSFISLEKALPRALALARPDAVLVALIKPQFEAGRDAVGKGGIVRDARVHQEVRDRIARFLQGEGWDVIGQCESPIPGGDGNAEFLIAARKTGRAGS